MIEPALDMSCQITKLALKMYLIGSDLSLLPYSYFILMLFKALQGPVWLFAASDYVV
jgi:hypothetical protein